LDLLVQIWQEVHLVEGATGNLQDLLVDWPFLAAIAFGIVESDANFICEEGNRYIPAGQGRGL